MDKEKAASAIKAAFYCGIISTSLTLIATLIGMYRGSLRVGGIEFSVFSLIDVVLMIALTVGLYFKSRVCATLMLVYFVYCKYVQWSAGVQMPGLFLALTFLYFYIQGVRGTLAFHKLKKNEASQPPAPTPPSVTPPAEQPGRQP
jgi:serine/threonine-protein kinase